MWWRWRVEVVRIVWCVGEKEWLQAWAQVVLGSGEADMFVCCAEYRSTGCDERKVPWISDRNASMVRLGSWWEGQGAK